MPPKRKKTSSTKEATEGVVPSEGSHVFVLSYVAHNHAGEDPEKEIVGVYNSKAAAVAHAGSVNTDYGTFDEAIAEDFEDCHEDNREEAPDDGVLIQIGDEDVGEGDHAVLFISKMTVLGMPTAESKAKKAKGQTERYTARDFGYS